MANESPPSAVASDMEIPDLVGEELGDYAHIWREYDRVAKEDDRERIEHWNRGLDNLALFAGLFSAVTTAFIIESQQDTKPDYMQLTFLVLNATAAGQEFSPQPFVIDKIVRIINRLWISSLLLSLTAALIAIMGKDWIGMYATRPVCNPRQWAEIRTYRLTCVERWRMSAVIATAPVLLHISLILFAAGLVLFVAPDLVSQRLALSLSLATGALYLVAVLSAVLISSSPFKSPATEAIRGSLLASAISFWDFLAYRPKRNPVMLLQQAALIAATLFSHPLPTSITPINSRQRRALQRARYLPFWNYLISADAPAEPSSLPLTMIHAARSLPGALFSFGCSTATRLRSAWDELAYRRQRPRTKPWHYPVGTYVNETVLSGRWAEVRTFPTPELLGPSLSLLSETSASPTIFRSIMVAIGDQAIGSQVALFLSDDLWSRLVADVRHNWHKSDLQLLSRFILADRNLLDTPLLPYFRVETRFDQVVRNPALRSEHSLFALIKVLEGHGLYPTQLSLHFPEITNQPRGLDYLIQYLDPAIPHSCDMMVMLAGRYWHHIEHDRSEVQKFAQRLRDWLGPARGGQYMEMASNHFGGRSGVIELLSFFISTAANAVAHPACTIILSLLRTRLENATGAHPCLAHVFGSELEHVVDAVWANREWTYLDLSYLADALPLLSWSRFRFDSRDGGRADLDVDAFERRLALCVIRMLSPKHTIVYLRRPTGGDGNSDISHTELCVRCLNALLRRFDRRSAFWNSADAISLLIQTGALISAIRVLEDRNFSDPTTTERGFINILTLIARFLSGMLSDSATFEDGVRLFGLFAFSEATDADGETVKWDLGEYMREKLEHLPDDKPSTAVSMQRLVRALSDLRSFSIGHENLRSAWERIELPEDPDETYPRWDFSLSDFFRLNETPATCGVNVPPAPQALIGAEDFNYLLDPELVALEASMR